MKLWLFSKIAYSSCCPSHFCTFRWAWCTKRRMRRVRLEKAEDKIGNTEHPAANNFSAATRTTFRLLGLAHGTTPHMSPSLGEPLSDSEDERTWDKETAAGGQGFCSFTEHTRKKILQETHVCVRWVWSTNYRLHGWEHEGTSRQRREDKTLILLFDRSRSITSSWTCHGHASGHEKGLDGCPPYCTSRSINTIIIFLIIIYWIIY